MAIEIVDLPMNSRVDLSIATVVYQRVYLIQMSENCTRATSMGCTYSPLSASMGTGLIHMKVRSAVFSQGQSKYEW